MATTDEVTTEFAETPEGDVVAEDGETGTRVRAESRSLAAMALVSKVETLDRLASATADDTDDAQSSSEHLRLLAEVGREAEAERLGRVVATRAEAAGEADTDAADAWAALAGSIQRRFDAANVTEDDVEDAIEWARTE